MTERSPEALGPSRPFPSGLGVTADLIRSIDWSQNPLGPMEGWPSSLKGILSIMLHSFHPMFLWWGPELIQFYNDGYLPSFGEGKHPAAMGQRGRDCWQEIWPIIGPQIEDVMLRAKPSWHEDHLVPILRNGRLEEVYWTYGYSPVFDETGGVGGTLVVVTETTTRVVAERRFMRLQQVGEAMAGALDARRVVDRFVGELAKASHDIPFALVRLHGSASFEAGHLASVGLAPELLQQLEPALASLFEGHTTPDDAPVSLTERFPGVSFPGGFWPESSTRAFVVPIRADATSDVKGTLVFGLSPRHAFDAAYRDFLEQLGQKLALVIGRVEAQRLQSVILMERNNLLLQAPVATALFSGPEHVFVLANRHYAEMMGRDDLVGKPFREVFSTEDGLGALEILDRVYQTGESFVANEFHARLPRHPHGPLEDRYFQFNLEALRNPQGQVYGMMVVSVEITEQVIARQILERAHAEREALLSELEAANRAKDEFLAMLGHELRNPLSPIVTALQLMELDRDGGSSKEQQVVARQVAHMVRLVDDLLDVSRITRGLIELKKEPVNVPSVLSKAVEIAGALFDEKKHKLLVEVSREAFHWEGDPVRLAQVVANLLTNAARYTPPGGEVRLSSHREADELVIIVKDNGRGISPELLPRIFDVFVQGRRGPERREGGLGIGLTLVKNLVALHGGTVQAKSEGPGRGSEFVVRLPMVGVRSEEVASPLVRPRARRVCPGKERRVLVVDDNVDAAESLGKILTRVGHEVRVAHDPLVALEVLERLHPQFAVLDLGLPIMDGYALAAQIRQSPGGEGCRLIALTGYGQEQDRLRSREAGFDMHLVKPLDLGELLRALESE